MHYKNNFSKFSKFVIFGLYETKKLICTIHTIGIIIFGNKINIFIVQNWYSIKN